MNAEQLKEALHRRAQEPEATSAPMPVLLASDSEGNSFSVVGEVTLCRGHVRPDGSAELVEFKSNQAPPVIVLWPKN